MPLVRSVPYCQFPQIIPPDSPLGVGSGGGGGLPGPPGPPGPPGTTELVAYNGGIASTSSSAFPLKLDMGGAG